MPDSESLRMALVELPHISPNVLIFASLAVALLAVVGELQHQLCPHSWPNFRSEFFLVVLILFRSRTSAKKNGILLLGSSDAGKTAILSTVRRALHVAKRKLTLPIETSCATAKRSHLKHQFRSTAP